MRMGLIVIGPGVARVEPGLGSCDPTLADKNKDIREGGAPIDEDLPGPLTLSYSSRRTMRLSWGVGISAGTYTPTWRVCTMCSQHGPVR